MLPERSPVIGKTERSGDFADEGATKRGSAWARSEARLRANRLSGQQCCQKGVQSSAKQSEAAILPMKEPLNVAPPGREVKPACGRTGFRDSNAARKESSHRQNRAKRRFCR